MNRDCLALVLLCDCGCLMWVALWDDDCLVVVVHPVCLQLELSSDMHPSGVTLMRLSELSLHIQVILEYLVHLHEILGLDNCMI